MPYLAMMNVPGFLPDSEPAEFDTVEDAWWYLYHERINDELSATDGGAPCPICNDEIPTHGVFGDCDDDTDTATALGNAAIRNKTGEVYGDPYPAPDCELIQGLVYTVTTV
jgi:hypothetical protein